MKRIIYREDGGVSIIIPAPKSRRVVINRDKIASNINRVREIYILYYTPDDIKVLTPEDLMLRLLDKDEFKAEFLMLELEDVWLKRIYDKTTAPIYKNGIQINHLHGTSYKDITNDADLPSDRFRSAWEKGADKPIEINLAKAKDQVMTELRTVRDKELIRQMGLMIRANDIGMQDEIDTLKIQRQKLRDLPQTINLENMTVAELEVKFLKQLTIDEYLAI